MIKRTKEEWLKVLSTAEAGGLYATEVAASMGVSQQTIASACKRVGIKLRDGRGDNGPKVAAAKTDFEKIGKVRALASQGLLQVEAAEAMGVSRQRIQQMSVKHGISFRHYSEEIGAFLKSNQPEGARQ